MSIGVLVLPVVLAACGGAGPDLTTEEQLEKLAGRDLTMIEIEDQLERADLLCGFDTRILVEIWASLDARQLEFQDYVFGAHCPDRMSDYLAARPDMGTVPVTTAPSTTTTTRPSKPLSEAEFLELVEPDRPN